MRIQHNIAALNSYRNLGVNNSGVAKNLEKLSSGYRINRAGDDAARLAISEKMRSQITGLNTATKNANDGISLVQTAEGALTEVHSMLNRMVEIATQSANGVYEDTVDRNALQDEMNALTDEIDRISEGTNFNKKNLLNGDITNRKIAAFTTSDPTGANASADFLIDLAAKDSKGNAVAITIKVVSDADEKLDWTNTNELTITLKQKTDYSASDIENLLRTGTYATTATPNDGLQDVIKNAIVLGSGVKAGTGAGLQAQAAQKIEAKDVDKAMNLQIGDTNDDFNKLEVGVRKMDAASIGIKNIKVNSEEKAGDAVDAINKAINLVSSQRGQLGAIQNRLEHTINNLSVNAENMTAAESRIRDVDMADEMMKYTKNNILVQASQAMLAQANQVPQGVLQLLQ